MQKLLLFVCCLLFALRVSAQFNLTIPSGTDQSASNRGPNANVNYHIMCAYYDSTELDMFLMPQPGYPFTNGIELTQLGFEIDNQIAASIVTGTIKVYLENTTDLSYNKSNTWSTCTASMTEVYDGAITISTINGVYYLNLTTPFIYTGHALYLAFEYENPSTTLSGINTTYMGYNGVLSGIQYNTSTTAMPTSLAGTGSGAGSIKPNMSWVYRYNGQEIAIRNVNIPYHLSSNTSYPISITLENLGNINSTNDYTVTVKSNSSIIGTINILSVPVSGTATYSLNWLPPTADTFYKIVTNVVTSGDYSLANNSDTSTVYVFPEHSILKEDFDDPVKFRDTIYPISGDNIPLMENGWSFYLNDLSGRYANYRGVTSYEVGLKDHLYDESPYQRQALSTTWGADSVDKWLISPIVTGYCNSETDSLVFYLSSDIINDSVEVWLSPTGGSSLSDFTIKAAEINIDSTNHQYYRYAYKVNSFLPTNTTNYRFALRYHHAAPDLLDLDDRDGISMDDISITREQSFTSTSGYIINGLTVNFNGASTMPGTITYQWDFTNNGSFDSNQQNPSYTYTVSGTYTVHCLITNGCAVYDTLLVVNLSSIGIFENDVNASLSILPNPAKDEVTLTLKNSNHSVYILELLNMLGERIYYTTSDSDNIHIRTSEFLPGTYIIRVISTDKKTTSRKLLIYK